MVPMKPCLKILNDKLYVSRKPGIITWFLFILTITVLTTLFHYLTNGIFVLTIFILGEIIFGLDAFGEWEELMLDKNENLATFTKYSWYDKLFNKSSNLRIKLSDIRHVGVSQNMGLFMLPRNGKAVTFNTRGLRRDEVQNIKRDINSFLTPSRIDYMERNLGDHFLNVSDSDQYLQSLLRKCSRRSILQEVPFSTTEINGRKANTDSSIHQHQSTPSLVAYNTAEKSPETSFKKRPYNFNNILQTIPSLQIRHRNWVPKR